jgi:serine/threonine-protein kinase
MTARPDFGLQGADLPRKEKMTGSDGERWAQADALFARALELPEAERASFVEQSTSGDRTLFDEVMALLTSVDQAGEVIGESVAELIGHEPEGASELEIPPGTVVGAYRIVDEIGRGGMGTVYLAERADREFDRRVAIKFFKDDLVGVETSRRFRAERHILASLEHPNIARLYDSGTTETGRPFLVLEHVVGERIDRSADARRLDLPGRVGMFLAVCEAVSYAHRRLVIHRDLKPGNVLVNDQGEVKLLDFGIAKLLASDGDGTPGEPVTRTGARPLTPEYAAPEQVRGAPAGTAADVYSLGVLLHELLVGVRPRWQGRVLERATVAELEAAVVPPSAALFAERGAAADEKRRAVAEARRLSPDRLRVVVRGDLDTIVLTALAPDESRRYTSVDALSADLRCWLEQRPITARRPSAGYRIAKFVRRNRALVSLGGAAALLALAFVTSVVVQSRRVAVERDRARFEEARAAEVVRVLTELFAGADPFATERRDTLRLSAFLDDGVSQVERTLTAQPEVQAELLRVLGEVLSSLDRLDDASAPLERSVSLRRSTPGTDPLDLSESLDQLGRLRLRETRLEEAESIFREASALSGEAGPAGRASLGGALGGLAEVMMATNRLDSAALLYDSALTLTRAVLPTDSSALGSLLNGRAVAAQRAGDYTASLGFMQESYELKRAALGADHPAALIDLGNLGFLTFRTGAPADAVPLLRDASEGLRATLGPDHPQLAGALANLGRALAASGRLDEAIAVGEEAVAIVRRRSPEPTLEVAMYGDNLAGQYSQAGRMAEAEASYWEAYQIMDRQLGANHPNTAAELSRFATVRCRRPDVTDAVRGEALANHERAIAVIDSVLPPDHPQRVARHQAYGDCLARTGRPDRARIELEGAYDATLAKVPPDLVLLESVAGDLIALYLAAGDSTAAARIRTEVDAKKAGPNP